jgi:hypothetical protein
MRYKALAVAALGLPVVLGAQSVDTLNLLGRSSINVGMGLTGQRSAKLGFSGIDAKMTGEIGSFGFSHWVHPEVAITIGAAMLGAQETVSGGGGEANAVMPILFGVSYSPRALALGTSLRPYVSLAAGPYFHSVSEVGVSGVSAAVETVAGMRSALGANWFVARHFMMSLEGDYHAVGHLDQVDAAGSQPGGFGMSLALGVTWGGK